MQPRPLYVLLNCGFKNFYELNNNTIYRNTEGFLPTVTCK